MNTLIVIAHHNGSRYIPALLDSLKWHDRKDIVVIDTGSTSNELDLLPQDIQVDEIYGGYCVGAYKWAYRWYPDYDSYFFMHDSMRAKTNFLPAFQSKGDVVAWIDFPMDYGEQEREYIESQYGKDNHSPNAIFGPIFYATHQAMQGLANNNKFPRNPKNRAELCASERAFAIAFHQCGFRVDHLEEYDNQRLDISRDYVLFDKFRPNRV